jgi:hypothetical protein
MSTGECDESNQRVMQHNYDQHNHAPTRRQWHHSSPQPAQSSMNIPQDPIFNGNLSSNQKSPFDFHAEEKKQDDDPMDIELRSSSAALTNDTRGAHFRRTGQPPHAVHNHVTESSGSEVKQNINRSSDCRNEEASSASKASPSEMKVIPPSDRIILSLNDEYYKEIMWQHYRILGKTRDSAREVRIGNDIFSIFKQTMGRNGRFFKRAQDQDFEVDDETSLASKFDIAIHVYTFVLLS